MEKLKSLNKLLFTILLIFPAVATVFAASDTIKRNPSPVLVNGTSTIAWTKSDSTNRNPSPVSAEEAMTKPAENSAGYKFDISKNMPWIGAIFIGLLTIISNLIIGHTNRKNSFDLLSKQIDSSKDIAFRQIDQNRQNSERDFAKSVLSGNRQVWINELGNVVAKILATGNRVVAREKIGNEQMDELSFLFAKVRLLSATYDYRDFENTVEQMELLLLNIQSGGDDFADLKVEIVNFYNIAIKIMQEEWEKVKTGK